MFYRSLNSIGIICLLLDISLCKQCLFICLLLLIFECSFLLGSGFSGPFEISIHSFTLSIQLFSKLVSHFGTFLDLSHVQASCDQVTGVHLVGVFPLRDWHIMKSRDIKRVVQDLVAGRVFHHLFLAFCAADFFIGSRAEGVEA